MRIYKGVDGPVVVVQEGSTSPLPLDHLSEYAVRRFLEALPSSRARFFERHISGVRERWFEVVVDGNGLRRVPVAVGTLRAARSVEEGAAVDRRR